MPLIIAVPESIIATNTNRHELAGSSSSALVELVDVYPTLADLAGLPDVPENLAGRSLRPLLSSEEGKLHDEGYHNPAYSQFPRNEGLGGGQWMGLTVRTDEWRYTEWLVDSPQNQTFSAELYSHVGDPSGDGQAGNTSSYDDFENLNVAGW